jgi:8-oxo-dGTP pyrophosphatase MutT (NUDIX family)
VHNYEVASSRTVYCGRVITVRTDRVRTPAGDVAERDVVEHPGAVMIVALDDAGRVLLVTQYRHPVGGYLTELPAGLLDHPGEDPSAAARRELHEEGDLTAATWHTLLDLRISPGGMNERGRIYLARDLTTVPELDRHHRGTNGEYEEADMRSEWVDLDRAVDRALAGDIQNGTTVAGLLATVYARDHQWQSLRPADIPWIPQHLTGS